MNRTLWHRDFTLARAGILALLMAFAFASDAVPQAFGVKTAGGEWTGNGVHIIPAVIHMLGVDCDKDSTIVEA